MYHTIVPYCNTVPYSVNSIAKYNITAPHTKYPPLAPTIFLLLSSRTSSSLTLHFVFCLFIIPQRHTPTSPLVRIMHQRKRSCSIMPPHPPRCPTHHGEAIVASEAPSTYCHLPILPTPPRPPSVDCQVIRPALCRCRDVCRPAAPCRRRTACRSCRAACCPAAPCRCRAASPCRVAVPPVAVVCCPLLLSCCPSKL